MLWIAVTLKKVKNNMFRLYYDTFRFLEAVFLEVSTLRSSNKKVLNLLLILDWPSPFSLKTSMGPLIKATAFSKTHNFSLNLSKFGFFSKVLHLFHKRKHIRNLKAAVVNAVLFHLGFCFLFLQDYVFGKLPHRPLSSETVTRVLCCIDCDHGSITWYCAQTC